MLKELRQNFGITLVYVGVTTSMFLNYFSPMSFSWTPLIMLVSCLLLCDQETFGGKMHKNHTFKMILAFQAFMLFYLFLAFNENSGSTISKQFSFHAYIICLCLVVMRTPSLRQRNFLPVLFSYSGILVMIAAFCHYSGLIALERLKDTVVLETFCCNIAAFINFCAALLILRRNKILLDVIILLLIFLDLYVIFQSGKRSYFVSVLCVTLIYLYKMQQLKNGLLTILLLYCLAVCFIPEVRTMTMELIQRTIDGFSTVYVDKKSNYVDWDNSESIRAWSQRVAVEKFNTFNIFNLIFGGGYLYWFFDNPLGESYLDMGVIGLFFYVYLIVYIPIRFFIKNHQDKDKLFFFFIALMNICIILVNNDPYIYLNYTPLCMMALFSYKTDFN